ncbi:MgtC/SapB family protein [Sinorhizobium meliloti]|uniref:MgtC/SapB family protein n=1 Tax=Rhizobium meliloti TaxID=382 RepID=UPI000FD816AF|nr:MgtC/SapB family protein [Sinorhizobium meliloti]RVG73122.1 MgtC/SapB family protein [Sinorhizobium meliloti]
MAEHVDYLYNILSISSRLVAALLLGALVGIERQWRQQHTGLTTHALVALGAAAYSAVPEILGATQDIRMGGQVVTGIGFLGAGLIMRDGMNVRGLNTAATVWATGAIGVFAGYGLLLEAAEAALMIVFINIILPRFATILNRYAPDRKEIERFYIVELKCPAKDEADVRSNLLKAMRARRLRLHSLESHAIVGTSSVEVEAIVYSEREEDELVEVLVGEMSLSPKIFSSSWTSTTQPE